jgi:hypothetical protein
MFETSSLNCDLRCALLASIDSFDVTDMFLGQNWGSGRSFHGNPCMCMLYVLVEPMFASLGKLSIGRQLTTNGVTTINLVGCADF